jgi:hypothetical protein
MSETARTDPLSDPVRQPLAAFHHDESSNIGELLNRLGLQHRPTFRKNYLRPALAGGWIEMTRSESPAAPIATRLILCARSGCASAFPRWRMKPSSTLGRNERRHD